jgi:hypothetical protein
MSALITVLQVPMRYYCNKVEKKILRLRSERQKHQISKNRLY